MCMILPRSSQIWRSGTTSTPSIMASRLPSEQGSSGSSQPGQRLCVDVLFDVHLASFAHPLVALVEALVPAGGVLDRQAHVPAGLPAEGPDGLVDAETEDFRLVRLLGTAGGLPFAAAPGGNEL